MLPYILLVVDMEPQFKAANDPATIKAAQREIIQAKADGAGVLFLESNGHKTTLSQLQSLTEGYDQVCFESKSQSDGCWAVMAAMRAAGWQTAQFRVLGVNTDVCVLQTVLSLTHWLPDTKFEVVQDACNAEDNPKCWSWYRGKNITLRRADGPSLPVDPFMPSDLRKFIYTGMPF